MGKKQTVALMIEKFKLLELKYDFMGYPIDRREDLSYHHLLIAKKVFEQNGITDNYEEWNGAILNRNSSHNYLHTIAEYDYEAFLNLTTEMHL